MALSNVNVVLYVHILTLDTKLHHNESNNNNNKLHRYQEYPSTPIKWNLMKGDIPQGWRFSN